MKKKTIMTLLFAGVLTVGAFTGLTGFADKDDTTTGGEKYTLLSAADVDETSDVNTSGGITGVEDVAAEVMPRRIDHEPVRSGSTGYVWFLWILLWIRRQEWRQLRDRE